MPGLDPGIHEAFPRTALLRRLRSVKGIMDCRVKPGNDRVVRQCAQYFAEIGNSSAGNSEITVWPLSVTTISSSMRAAE